MIVQSVVEPMDRFTALHQGQHGEEVGGAEPAPAHGRVPAGAGRRGAGQEHHVLAEPVLHPVISPQTRPPPAPPPPVTFVIRPPIDIEQNLRPKI